MRHPASYISDHLLVSVALSYIAGIAVSPLIGQSETNYILFNAILFFSLSLLVVLQLLKKSTTLFCLIVPVVFGIGGYHGYLHLQVPADKNHIYNRIVTKTDLVLIGTMSTMAGFDGRTSLVTIETKSIRMKAPTCFQQKEKYFCVCREPGQINFLQEIQLPFVQS